MCGEQASEFYKTLSQSLQKKAICLIDADPGLDGFPCAMLSKSGFEDRMLTYFEATKNTNEVTETQSCVGVTGGKSRARAVVHRGPRGGMYIIKKGRRVYIDRTRR